MIKIKTRKTTKTMINPNKRTIKTQKITLNRNRARLNNKKHQVQKRMIKAWSKVII